jgi:capsular exopolysaccharide synthesis family protein
MSHIFELFRKANLQGPNSAWGDTGAGPGLAQQDLPQSSGSDFPQIPVEEVDLRPETRVAFHADPGSPGADRFRLLRMRLHHLRKEKNLRSLLVTSPLPEDGKSTIALNLATALAEQGRCKVLLIEGDLHQPCLSSRLGLGYRPGLAECLEGTLSPLSAIRRLEPLGWCLLAAGNPERNPTELLQTDAFSGVMQELSLYFDWILIDSPPVLPLTDALLLKQQADATLLVARAGHTPGNAVEEAMELVGRKHVVSIVLNCAEKLGRLYSDYDYRRSAYYKHGRGAARSENKNR